MKDIIVKLFNVGVFNSKAYKIISVCSEGIWDRFVTRKDKDDVGISLWLILKEFVGVLLDIYYELIYYFACFCVFAYYYNKYNLIFYLSSISLIFSTMESNCLLNPVISPKILSIN